MKPIPEMPTRNMSLFQDWLGRKARGIDLGIDDFHTRRAVFRVGLGRAAALGEQFFDDVAVDVGEASVDAIVAHAKLGVVDTEEVEDGGVDVVDFGGGGAHQWFVSPLIALAGGDPALDAAAAHPVGEAIRIMIAAGAALA